MGSGTGRVTETVTGSPGTGTMPIPTWTSIRGPLQIVIPPGGESRAQEGIPVRGQVLSIVGGLIVTGVIGIIGWKYVLKIRCGRGKREETHVDRQHHVYNLGRWRSVREVNPLDDDGWSPQAGEACSDGGVFETVNKNINV